MAPERVGEDLLAVMRIIGKQGGTDCSGSCHHRKPGEFHCHTISQMLRISSSGVKERILTLVRMGLLERRRVLRDGTYPLTRFELTPEGETLLAARTKSPDV